MGNGLYSSTVDVASEVGVPYAEALAWAESAGLAKVGTAFVWTPEDVAAFTDELEGDEEDDEDDDEDDELVENPSDEDGEPDLDDEDEDDDFDDEDDDDEPDDDDDDDE